MATQTTYDSTTTTAMVAAFDTAEGECTTVASAVSSAQSTLSTQWSGAAATAYNASISEWQAGFQEVRSGLAMLDEAMQYYRRFADETEQGNTGTAGGWAKEND